MKKNNNYFDKRIIFLLILFLLLFIVAISRLLFIQVINRREFQNRAMSQINSSEDIDSNRGSIYDRNLKKLAVNVPAAKLYVNGKLLDNDDKKRDLASKLSIELDEDEDDIYKKLKKESTVLLKQRIDLDTANKIRSKKLPGVEFEEGYQRFYPNNDMASHLLGFVNSDGVGQYGIEAFYNDDLTGKSGRIYKTADGGRRQVPTGETRVYDASDGLSAVLTIDQEIQSYAEEEASKIMEEFNADGVQIIVEDVKSGEILAMVSNPNYNNNDPASPVNGSQKRAWEKMNPKEIQNDWFDNWSNKAVNYIYEPGSTFKLITTAAAIEENETNPNEHYYCSGYIRDIKGAPVIKCVNHNLGDLTLTEALERSCNSTMVYVARDLGREKFVKYIKGFGFGAPTGIDLKGELSGLIPKNPENISEISLATMSYGHGIAITPIQLISAVSSFGNNGVLLEPRILKELVDNNGNVVYKSDVIERRQVVSKNTSDTMLKLMQSVIENGNAKNAHSDLYNIGGKTGTANKLVEGKGYIDGEYISSFIGLAPIEDPKIAVLVIVDNSKTLTYGSQVAAPSAKKVIEYSLDKIDNINRSNVNSDSVELTMPNVEYRLISDAGMNLRNLGLSYNINSAENITEESVVISQKPKAGTKIKSSDIIDLEIDTNYSNTIIVPDFRNLTYDKLMELNKNTGFKFEFSKSKIGVINKQSPEPGNRMTRDKSILLEFNNDEESEHLKDFVDEDLDIQNNIDSPVINNLKKDKEN